VQRNLSYFPTRRSSDLILDRFDETKKGTNTGFLDTIHGFLITEKEENAALFVKGIIKARIVIEKAIGPTIEGIFSEKNQASLTRSEEHTSELQSRENLV